ncbi:unnamed protein product [Effrenium voratum]|nr:unnamed protein product [Effrenium voratum]
MCNPNFVQRLHRRFKKTNTFAAEHVFAWFRNYARSLNETRPQRHSFKVLVFCKWRNQSVKNKKVGYLNRFASIKRKGNSSPYTCFKKPAAR